jgi:hypothetical protein
MEFNKKSEGTQTDISSIDQPLSLDVSEAHKIEQETN